MAPTLRRRTPLVLLGVLLSSACDSGLDVPPVINNSPPTAEAGGPYSGIVGQPTVLDGSASQDGEGAIARYDWTVEDGVPTRLEGAQPEYTCVAGGTFTVTLTVRDGNDAPDSDAGSITCVVQNLLPTAAPGGPYVSRVGNEATLDGSGSTDPDGTIESWSWAVADGGPTLLQGETAAYTCDAQGSFDVTLTVTDDRGNTASGETTLECVQNVPPTAVTEGPYSVRLGSRAFLDGRGSNDPDGSIVSHRWVVEDGGPTVFTQSTAFYDCIVPAVYDVSLTVTDNEGATGTETTTLSCVANVPPTADPGGPYSAEVGQSVTLDGGDSDDPDGSIVSWAWSVADPGAPTVLSGRTASYACTVGGTFSVTLTVADNEGGTSTASTSVQCVPNAPPSANAGGPYSGRVGRDVTLDGRASSDSDGSIVSYAWSVDDGGAPTTLTGSVATYSCGSAGTYALTLTVTDDDGATGTATTSLACVANVAPTADPGGPYAGAVGSNVAFDGTESSDPDGSIVSYSWNVADAGAPTILTGPTPTYTCAESGNWSVTLTVSDNDGASDNALTQVNCTAANTAPTADAGGPYAGTMGGGNVTFDGTGSADADGSIETYAWSVVDGGAPTELTGATPGYSCPSAGIFTVNLTVTDDDGATGTDATNVNCSAANQDPTADAGGPYSGSVGESVSFDGTGSDDPDGTIAGYVWEVSDGGDPTILTTATPNYTCPEAGGFAVTLTVTDNQGATAQAGTSVTCEAVDVNEAPTAEANGPYAAVQGESVTLSSSGSADADGSITGYSWSIADGVPTVLDEENPSYTCEAVGSFTATLTVTDDDGATGQDTATINCTAPATNIPPTADAGGPYAGIVDGADVTFDGSGSTDSDGDIESWDWSVSDGNTTSGETTGYGCDEPGVFDVTLTVTDDDDATDEDNTTVECTAPEPTNVRVDFAAADGSRPPNRAPEFSPLAYRVRVENTSETIAEDVALTVTIDPDATGVTATDLEADGNVWSGSRAAIAPGESWDVVFSLTLESEDNSPHLSLAEVSAPLDPDGEDGDNRAQLRIRVVDQDA